MIESKKSLNYFQWRFLLAKSWLGGHSANQEAPEVSFARLIWMLCTPSLLTVSLLRTLLHIISWWKALFWGCYNLDVLFTNWLSCFNFSLVWFGNLNLGCWLIDWFLLITQNVCALWNMSIRGTRAESRKKLRIKESYWKSFGQWILNMCRTNLR